MKTIKIIDLLNKIANGEEAPKKIKYEGKIYIYYEAYAGYYEKDCEGIYNKKFLTFRNEQYYKVLNEELEILDEDDEFEDIEELNKSDYQYSQCPSWKEKEEVIKIMNNNFELHQKAIRDIIQNQKKIIERLKDGE